MITINPKQTQLGFVPLTVAGAKLGADAVAAIATTLPGLFKNDYWKDAGGNIDQLQAANAQISAMAAQSQQTTDQLITKLQQDIASNRYLATTANTVSNDKKEKTANVVGWAVLALVLAGGGYMWYKNSK